MPKPLWTSGEIAAATGGTLSGLAFAAAGVSIDTRSLEPGDLFVALAGVRDGHEFVEGAMRAGAAGVLAAQPVQAPAVLVRDTQAALEALGLAARERAPLAKRGAVTGSVGKTSVTQAIAAGLRKAGRAHSSVKSYNNHIGVPLTLARMPADTQRAVFEIGMNHADEIRPLSKMVRPHAAVVTTVGPVHMENFAEGERGVALAKAEIFEGLVPGGLAVLNADNPWFELLSERAKAAGSKIASFGSAATCDARLLSIDPQANGGGRIRAELRGRALDFKIAPEGAFWGLNSLAILLMLEALDAPLEAGLEALAEFGPLAGRGQVREVALDGGGFTVVDESYNANPVSMAAVIATLGARPTTGRRIVALTDMLELGPDSPALHAGLAEAIEAAKVDLVFCAGPLMHHLWSVLPAKVRGAHAPDAKSLAPQVKAAVRPGDVVLVKGSNGSKASLIAEALSRFEAAATPAGEGR